MIAAALVKLGSVAESILTDKFKESVIARWTRFRATAFFEGFVKSLQTEQAAGHEIPDVDKRLDAIIADENKSEILFDAYRRVCFTKSKTLGPRIIGLLTGQLVIEGRMATQAEECIFDAAESLSDIEFVDFLKEYQEHYRRYVKRTEHTNEVHSSDKELTVSRNETELGKYGGADIGPFPWNEAFGSWAVKLNQCGLMTARIHQTVSHGPRDIFTGGRQDTVRVRTEVIFEPGCMALSRLVLRSLGSEHKE
jgi:hypothetical protein